MNLCKYANIFGEPGTGVHSVRLFGVAIIDVIITIICAIITNILIKGDTKSLIIVTLIWFVLGIISHKIFCVKTTIHNLIFGK